MNEKGRRGGNTETRKEGMQGGSKLEGRKEERKDGRNMKRPKTKKEE